MRTCLYVAFGAVVTSLCVNVTVLAYVSTCFIRSTGGYGIRTQDSPFARAPVTMKAHRVIAVQNCIVWVGLKSVEGSAWESGYVHCETS